jgi:voltage-gated sodium channel
MNMQTKTMQHHFTALHSHKAFEAFVICVIIISALLVGAKTYNISPMAQQIITLLDWAITLIFLAELSIRFIGDEHKSRFFLKAWNIFDTLIVIASLIPIEDSEMALLGRTIRIFRVLRMVSFVPELRLLLNALASAMPQLGYVVALMFIIFYIYGAIGSFLFEAINPVLWGDISISMLTLFRIMTFEDWTDVMYETMEVYSLSWLFYLSFIFFTAFAFLNIVIGIVVNVLEKENERVRREEAEEDEVTLEALQLQLTEIKALLVKQNTSAEKLNSH